MSAHFAIRCRAVIVENGELLAVSHVGKESFLVLPGGHLEPGEGVREGLVREIVEELGVVPEIGSLLYVHTFTDHSGVPQVEFFFSVTNAVAFRSASVSPGTHAYELASVQWVTSTETRPFLPQAFWADYKIEDMPKEVRFIAG